MKRKIVKGFVTLTAVVAMMATLVGCGKSSSEESYRAVTVSDFNGNVVVSNAGAEAKDVYKDQRLVAQDVATVGNESGMSLVVDDDKALTVEANSKISVNAVGDKTNGKVTVDLIYGSVNIAIANKLQENDSFEVETTNAIMAVRGTQFNVEYDTQENITKVYVETGSVEVTSKETKQNVLIEEGQMAIVSSGDIEIKDGAEESMNPATYSPLKSEEWKNYADSIVDSKKSSGSKEINISSVEDYDNFVKSGDCDNTILYFESKTYDFTNSHYGILVVNDMNNVTFVGTGDTKIVVKSGDELIMTMFGDNDMTFYGMTFGHDIPQASGCTFGVISTSACNNIEFISCDIFGCGTVGADIESSNNIKFIGSVIRDCSDFALYLYESEVTMSDSVVSGNCYNGEEYPEFKTGLFAAYTWDGVQSSLTLDNCIIRDNLNSLKTVDDDGGFNITEIDCTYLNNNFD